jgi:thiosulfate dehydrogenase
MSRIIALLAVLIVDAPSLTASAQHIASSSPGSYQLPPWHVPDIAALADDDHGRQVRFGQALINHTTAVIGPDAPEAGQRYSRSGLECANCHLDGGTKRFGLPLVGIAGLYPKFSARVDTQQDLADRVNDCMERSMNGRPLPRDSKEMQAILAYLTFLGSDQPAGQAPIGRGAPKLPLPTRAASPQRGAAIFQSMCAACHQSDGLGIRLPADARASEQRRYLYPPLWGPESFNDAAGMARVMTGAWFVDANMPYGINFHYPLLAPDDAYDVMAFVVTRPRPHKADLAKDYPDRWLKPIGTMYPPWVGPFSAAQNRFGPWQPIIDWRHEHAPSKAPDRLPAANDLEQVVFGLSAGR